MTDEPADDDLSAIYRNRFDERELASKRVLWQVLVDDFFQRYVPRDGTVVDLGAGNCEFVNAVAAQRRVAVDLNPDTVGYAEPGRGGADHAVGRARRTDRWQRRHCLHVQLLRAPTDEVRPDGHAARVPPGDPARWPDRGADAEHPVPTGRYWDYLDHHLPLTDLSVAEALELSGYVVEERIGRFLPYTVKDARFEVRPVMVRSYLRVRPAWRFLGKQMLVVGRAR